MKHLEVRQKYSAMRRIFNSLLGVISGDETLRLMFDILRELLISGNNYLAKITIPTNKRKIKRTADKNWLQHVQYTVHFDKHYCYSVTSASCVPEA